MSTFDDFIYEKVGEYFENHDSFLREKIGDAFWGSFSETIEERIDEIIKDKLDYFIDDSIEVYFENNVDDEEIELCIRARLDDLVEEEL